MSIHDYRDDLLPLARASGGSHLTIQQRFVQFHAANPHVYRLLVRLARDLVQQGNRRVGIKMLYEVMRWQYALYTTGEPFKLSNDFHSRYARLIHAMEPDLDGVFALRELRSK